MDAGIDLWQENPAKADILTFCRKICEKIPEKLFVPQSWRPIDTCPASSNIALSHYQACPCLPACHDYHHCKLYILSFCNCRPEMLWKRMKKVCLNFLVVIEVCQIGKTGLCCKLWCLSPGNCSHQLMPPQPCTTLDYYPKTKRGNTMQISSSIFSNLFQFLTRLFLQCTLFATRGSVHNRNTLPSKHLVPEGALAWVEALGNEHTFT